MKTGGKRLNGATKQPGVSIITVLFNAAPLLDAYFTNVTPYLGDDVELVIIDGNSTDGTLNILEQHNHTIDYWLSEPDQGIYDAMNKAIKKAKGRWLFFLGADDYLMDGFTRMVAELQDEQTVYYGNTMFYGKPHTRVYDAYFLTKLNFVHQSLFYPRRVFDKYSYDTRFKLYADYYLNLQLWADADFRFEHRSHMVAGFNEGGASAQEDPLFLQQRDALFKKYLGRKPYYRYLNRNLGWFKTLIRIITNG